MTTSLPNISQTILRLSFLVFALFAFLLLFSKINPAYADDPWNCHNGCTRPVEGRVVDQNGNGVGGVVVHVRSVASWCADDACYDNQVNDSSCTTNNDGDFRSSSNNACAAFNNSTYDASIESLPAGVVSGSQKTTTTGSTWNYCEGHDTPYGSSQYTCQHRNYDDGQADSVDNSCASLGGRCNWQVQLDKPVVNIGNACTDTSGKYYGNAIQISWATSGVQYVDLGNSSGWNGWWINKYVGGSGSTTAMSGFGSGNEYLSHGDTYYVRLWDGSNHSPNSDGFTIPQCSPHATVTTPSCITSGYSGSGIQISWPSTSPAVSYIDVYNPSNPWGDWSNKAVSNSPTDATGFSGGRTYNPGTTYAIRTWNGSQNDLDDGGRPTFNIPACSSYLDLLLRVRAADPEQSYPFTGTFGYSGSKKAAQGSDWYNDLTVLLTAPAVQSGLPKAYFVAFYDQNQGLKSDFISFKANVENLLNNHNERGFFLRYQVTTAVDSGATYNGGTFYVWNKTSWQAISKDQSLQITDSSNQLLYTVTPNSGSEGGMTWTIRFAPAFQSKAMYTAIYAEDNNGRYAFDADYELNNQSADSKRLLFRQ